MYILERQSFEFDMELYERVSKEIGDRSETIVNLPWASIQRLTVELMGFEKKILSLWKHPKEMDELVDAIQANDS